MPKWGGQGSIEWAPASAEAHQCKVEHTVLIRHRRRGTTFLLPGILLIVSLAAAIALGSDHQVHDGCTSPIQQPARLGGLLSYAAFGVNMFGLIGLTLIRHSSRPSGGDRPPVLPLLVAGGSLVLALACSLFYLWTFHSQCYSR